MLGPGVSSITRHVAANASRVSKDTGAIAPSHILAPLRCIAAMAAAQAQHRGPPDAPAAASLAATLVAARFARPGGLYGLEADGGRNRWLGRHRLPTRPAVREDRPRSYAGSAPRRASGAGGGRNPDRVQDWRPSAFPRHHQPRRDW